MPLRKPELVGHAEVDTRPAGRHDPAVELLMQAVRAGEVSLADMTRELLPFRRYGVTVSVEVMTDAIARVKERCGPPSQPKPVPQYRPRPVIGRRYNGVEYHGGEVVYYMRVGNRVKIGTTSNLELRLKTLIPEELLAIEDGGYAMERRRHREFKELRTNGEWFKYEGALVDHIAELKEAK